MSKPEPFTALRERTGRRAVSVATPRCSLCDAMQGTEAHYVACVLCDPGHLDANVRAIAEAFGFCPAHAGHVALADEHTTAIASVMRHALAATRALLDERPGMEDWLRDILFAAEDACPACSFAERRLSGFLGRHAAALRSHSHKRARAQCTLCLPHFQALIGISELPDLPQWTAAQIEILASAAAALETGGATGLSAVTRLVAGRRGAFFAASEPLGTACRVCFAMQAAKLRWLMLARESVRTDAAPGMILPTCPEHIWACHASADARLALHATRHALEVRLQNLRKAAVFLEEQARRLELSKRSVWYRAKNPAYILGQRRRAVTEMLRCPACERMAVARDRAVGELLEDLRSKRDSPERSHDLCMKHFAHARIIAPAGVVRDTLTSIQQAELSALGHELAEVPDRLWKQALAHLSGNSR